MIASAFSLLTFLAGLVLAGPIGGAAANYRRSKGYGSGSIDLSFMYDIAILDLGSSGGPSVWVDTGSSDTWVSSADLNNGSKPSYQEISGGYSVEYYSGQAWTGNFVKGPITIGDLTADLTYGVLDAGDNYGFLGLGFPGLQAAHYLFGYPTNDTFPFALRNQGHINRAAFSLFPTGESGKGTLLFGAIDHAKYQGPLFTLPIIYSEQRHTAPAPIDYYVQLDSLRVGDSYVYNEPTLALVDSDSQVALFPSPAYEAFLGLFGNYTYDPVHGVMYGPCDTPINGKNFIYQFGKNQIVVPASSFLMADDENPGKCWLFVQESNNGIFSFGNVFMSFGYFYFDQEAYQIKMAQALDRPTSHCDIEVIPKFTGSVDPITNTLATPTATSSHSSSRSTATSTQSSNSTRTSSRAPSSRTSSLLSCHK